jgi:hypothetical protein
MSPRAQEATPDACDRQQLLADLIRDFAPVGAAENLLVAELARRAINLQWWSDAACAVRDTAARTLAGLALPGICATAEHTSTTLAAAASCAAVDRAERASSSQSRAFTRSLKVLLELQARRREAEWKAHVAVVAGADELWSEPECAQYLVSWRQRQFVCGECGSPRAHFVPTQKCLECAKCGSQSGLRVGTVMSDSPLPLSIWFSAIRLVVSNPDIATGQLQTRLCISRAATVRGMANKINAALLANDRTALLAGLDRDPLLPEPSAVSQPDGDARKVEGHAQELIALSTTGKPFTANASTKSQPQST